MVVGTVLRSHAGGHLVYSDELGARLQCAARGRLKKERVSILTGDQVELDEIDRQQNTAVITARLERQSLIARPQIANVEQAVVVQAVHQPEWNPLLCDRYLVHCQIELPGIRPILCLNKCDLAKGEDIEALIGTYRPLGYTVILVSAITGQGMDELIASLTGKVSVLAGPSGVGKSSLINYLDPELNLKVGVMENDFGVGRHTTTYSELYRIERGAAGKSGWVADTPGFSVAELAHPEPNDVVWLFPEIAELAEKCRYTNCLHLVEQGCHILENPGKVSDTRYQSYCTLVAEAQQESNKRRSTSSKVESNVKIVGGKQGKGTAIPRLNSRYRTASRRTEKQQTAVHSDDEQLSEESEAGDEDM